MHGHELRLEAVSVRLADRLLIDRLTLTVRSGQVATLMGPSGSGKSSLLAYICGTLPPAFEASGAVRLDGEDLRPLPPEGRHLGILFQDDLLFPHMSVGGNLAFGLKERVRGRAQRRRLVEAALASAGLGGFAGRDPATLSGGQRARVAVLRVLLSEPRALLLDEPFSKLDMALRRQFRQFVFARAAEAGLPTLLVTHDPDDAASAGGPVIDLAEPRQRPRPAAAVGE